MAAMSMVTWGLSRAYSSATAVTSSSPMLFTGMSFPGGRRGGRSPASMEVVNRNSPSRPGLLHCSFTPSSSYCLSFPSSSFSGLSLGLDFTSKIVTRKEKGHRLVVRSGKAALCQTRRSRSRKSLARTHGFRRRMRTTSGRAVLKRRRDKGRKILCTKSNPSSGKRA